MHANDTIKCGTTSASYTVSFYVPCDIYGLIILNGIVELIYDNTEKRGRFTPCSVLSHGTEFLIFS